MAAQQSSVEGVVLKRATGQPIASAHVQLALGISNQVATQAYGAITDAEGRFSIAEMPPGYYTVNVERTGFIQGIGKEMMRGTSVELRPGEHRIGWKLEMSPLVMIAGRVVNQYGDPVQNIQIEPLEEGQNSHFDTVYSGFFHIKMTDERGQFRLFTPPGKYYLVAAPVGRGYRGPAEIRTDGTQILVYDPTYYPSSPDTTSAKMVEAKPDDNITGLVIQIRSDSPVNDLTVSGTITGIPAGSQANIAYRYGTSPGQFSMGGSSGVGPDGKFLINLHPGYVRLSARCVSGDTVLQSEPVEIHLEPPGSTNIQLTLNQATYATVEGNVEIIGDSSAASPARKIMVHLAAVDLSMAPAPGQTEVDSDGAFRLKGISPGRYSLSIYNIPDNAYIKSILLGNVLVREGVLDFSRGVPKERMRITISRNGAQISGEVRDAGGGPMLNPNISVVLVPQSGQFVQVRGAPVNEGKYLLKGIPPGKYKIYTADFTKRSAAARASWPGGDPDLAAAETVEVPEGGHVTRNLKVAVQEERDAHSKQ
jgi:protocatechuate 3,4-dioxygenase beta subunit